MVITIDNTKRAKLEMKGYIFSGEYVIIIENPKIEDLHILRESGYSFMGI